MLFDETIDGFADQFALTLAITSSDCGKLVSLTTGEIDLCSDHPVPLWCIHHLLGAAFWSGDANAMLRVAPAGRETPNSCLYSPVGVSPSSRDGNALRPCFVVERAEKSPEAGWDRPLPSLS